MPVRAARASADDANRLDALREGIDAECLEALGLKFCSGTLAKAAIGIHQIFAANAANPQVKRDEMSEAQRISARCQRFIGDMGIDLQVWVHAMETLKDWLHVIKPDGLKALNVVTVAPLNEPGAKVRS